MRNSKNNSIKDGKMLYFKWSYIQKKNKARQYKLWDI